MKIKLASNFMDLTVEVEEGKKLNNENIYGMFYRGMEDILTELGYYIYDEDNMNEGGDLGDKVKVVDWEFDCHKFGNKIILFIAVISEIEIKQLETIKIIFDIKEVKDE